MQQSRSKAPDPGPGQQDYQAPMRYFTWLLDPHNLPAAPRSRLLHNVPYTAQELSNPEQMIEWTVLCQICDNLGSIMSDAEILRLAQTSLKRPQNRLLTLVSRTLLNVREAYLWGYRADTGLVARTYPALSCNTKDLVDGRLQIEITGKPGARVPQGLQLLMLGQIVEIPEVFGLPAADVEMVALSNGVRYLVDHEENNRMIPRLRWGARRLLSRRATAHELNATLQEELGKLQSAMKALRKSESRYQLLANNIQDVIWTTDLRGHITYISPSVARYTRLHPRQIIASKGEQLLGGAANQRKIRCAVLRELALERRGRSDPQRRRTLELNFESAAGETLIFEVVVSIARDSMGMATGVLCVGRDISERQRLTRQIAEKRNLESLGLLAGGVAHDFNNLMTGVMGHAELVSAQLPQDSPVQSDLQRIVNSAESAAGLCKQMLAFSGKATLVESPVDLSRQIHRVLDLMRSSLPSKARIKLDLPETLPRIIADIGQIDQIIMNLVLNAAEALPETGGTLTVHTFSRDFTSQDLHHSGWREPARPGHYVCLQVTDDGKGIEPQIVDRIYEPFYSTKKNGRGMGLAAVAGVVRTYGGVLLVQSPAPGQNTGACFTVALPVSEQMLQEPATQHTQASPVVSPQTAGETVADSSDHRSRVLIIDDEATIRDVTGKLMHALGYDVQAAASGEEGLQMFSATPPQTPVDLVILDLTMPGMDGHETYQHLRQQDDSVPILFMSGYHQEGMSFSEGSDPHASFLPKPFHLQELRNALSDMQRAV